MQLVTHPQVQGQLRGDLEIIRREEVVGPAVAVRFDRRESPRSRGRDTEQEVSVRLAREPVSESDVAEKIVVGAELIVLSAQHVHANLDTVLALEPAQPLLQLLTVGPVALAGPRELCQ